MPFLLWWIFDPRTPRILSAWSFSALQYVVVLTLVYMAVRTWVAYKDPPSLKWWLVFPPVDVILITTILLVTRLGPMSNLTLLFFLPIVQASGTSSVRWTAGVAFMVIVGTVLSTLMSDPLITERIPTTFHQLLADPLNVGFRVLYLVVISSLMAYQNLINAGYREKLGVAADRNRIAMEMHDGVQGHLISIASQLELIARVAPTDGDRAGELAKEGRESARQAADELRFLVQRLRSQALASGFIPALNQYAHNICERNNIELEFQVIGEGEVAPEVENAMFRIAQEALANVVKHAHASKISVKVEFGAYGVYLSVRDNGKGFEMNSSHSGLGLEGMQWRAQSNRGKFKIESSTAVGTLVEAVFDREVRDV